MDIKKGLQQAALFIYYTYLVEAAGVEPLSDFN
jgi:hypothetical protein